MTATRSRRPAPPAVVTRDGSGYWEAREFTDAVLSEYEAARAAGNAAAMREHFYVLAAYYRRTLSILHSALEGGRETLAEAALRNLIVMQKALTAMREEDPDDAPSSLALEYEIRKRVNRDLVHRILRDARGPLRLPAILKRFNDLDLIADARDVAIVEALNALVQTGFAVERGGRYSAGNRPYIDADVDRAALSMVFGADLGRRLADAGFEGLSHVVSRRAEFRELFQSQTGLKAPAATLASAYADVLMLPEEALHAGGIWQHADLINSAHPRGYQRFLHAKLRAARYAGQVIEAPAGSGKTLIGMLCIDDWLRTMAPGESVLVLVPTVNYQRQWVGELCLKPSGLRLSPSAVFAGTPSMLQALRHRSGLLPAVIVMTYSALGQSASGSGRGGFDRSAVERILQANNIRHVILDEVHKVATDLDSAAAQATRVFRDWLRDGSLLSLVGFSGTLAGFEGRMKALGLELAHALPATDLIGQGWVAPFAEFGAPFNYSERERQVADLIDQYRTLLRAYVERVGIPILRAWFGAIPLAERSRLAAMLGMYAGRAAQDELIDDRMRRWETGEALGLNELQLVSIVQAYHAWTDVDLLREAGLEAEAQGWLAPFAAMRGRLAPLLPPGYLADMLAAQGFGERLDAAVFQRPLADGRGVPQAKPALASTFAGLYSYLRGWWRQTGEGRVAAVRSIIAAEKQTRRVSGTIVFDAPAPLEIDSGPVKPGYRGAGGMFVHMLGDRGVVPLAVLTSAVYLPEDPAVPLHDAIAAWIEREVLGREQRDALFALLATGSGLHERASAIRPQFDAHYEAYIEALTGGGATRFEDFGRMFLLPLRAAVRTYLRGRVRSSLLNWLSLDRHHLRGTVVTILDYAAIAGAFRQARRIEAMRGDGTSVALRVLKVPGGRRRQLLLDLSARIVDAVDLPFNTVIVSNWARTGWNIITPNILIDATATRDPTAWRQLRGRAMRPAPTWSGAAQRLVERHLDGGGSAPPTSLSQLPDDEKALAREVLAERHETPASGREFAERVAVSVMLARNKVTHVYELLRAAGSQPQVQRRYGGRWERTEVVAAKHRQEDGVRPGDSAFVPGTSHAPLVVAADPRRDTPEAFRARLVRELADVDERIVRGWLRAAATQTDVHGIERSLEVPFLG